MIIKAGEEYLEDPTGTEIPDWTRALAVMPDLRQRLGQAVSDDMQDVLSQLAPSFVAADDHGVTAASTEDLVVLTQ